MTESQKLLAEYVESGSEAAFRDLVGRYVNLVYSTALRQLGGDTQCAEDVTQTVFLRLAHNARRLARESSLGGWLHRDTCFVATKTLRRERRRQAREREAISMNSCDDHSQSNLEAVAPLLDEAINLLGNEDRTAILLRFFEQRDFRSVGEVLGSNEDAARKRVARALEKLQILLKRRGVALSAGALGTCLADKAIVAAPAALAASVAGSVLAGHAASLGISATLIKFMAMTKLKAGLLCALAAGGVTTSVLVYCQGRAKLGAQQASLRRQADQLAGLEVDNQRLSATVALAASPDNQSGDLAALRAQAESLRRQTNGLAGVRAENRRLSASAGDEPKTPIQSMEERRARVLCARDWLLACRRHALDHQGLCPTDFGQVASIHAQNIGKLSAKISPDEFEIVFQGSFDSLTNPAGVIVLRERQPQSVGDGKWSRIYGMADGAVHTMGFPRPGYDTPEAWEKEHVVAPRRQ